MRWGASTGACIRRILGSRPIVEQSFVQCRNVLGLAKRYSPEMLERACGRWPDAPGIPSCTALKDTILAIRAEDAADAAAAPREMRGGLVDRAPMAGRLRGADEWKRGAQDAH